MEIIIGSLAIQKNVFDSIKFVCCLNENKMFHHRKKVKKHILLKSIWILLHDQSYNQKSILTNFSPFGRRCCCFCWLVEKL